jgi:hypothetical protein
VGALMSVRIALVLLHEIQLHETYCARLSDLEKALLQ